MGNALGLDERRRVVRLPVAVDLPPRADVRPDHLDAGGPFGEEELEARVVVPVPLVVGDEEDLVEALVAVAAEDDAIVDPVDLDLRRTILVVALDESGIDGELAGELTAEADRPLVDVRLVHIRIEHAIAPGRRCAGRDLHGLEHAIEIVVVGIGPAGVAGREHGHTAGLHELAHPPEARPKDVPVVARQRVGGAEARANLEAVLGLDIGLPILTLDPVEAQPQR